MISWLMTWDHCHIYTMRFSLIIYKRDCDYTSMHTYIYITLSVLWIGTSSELLQPHHKQAASDFVAMPEPGTGAGAPLGERRI